MTTLSVDYPQDAAALYALVTDPDALEARAQAMGARDIEVQLKPADEGCELTCTRVMDSDLPAFAKRLFPSTNTVVERLQWHKEVAQISCRGHIEVEGSPASITTRATITPQGSGCRYQVELKATAKVPLIRKKLEAYIEQETLATMRQEHQWNKEWLAEHGD